MPANTLPLVNGQVKGKARRSLSPGEVERLPLRQPLDVAIARTTARKLAEEVGYSLIDQVRLSTAVFDLAEALVASAAEGELVILWREDDRRKGLQFFCHDQGRRVPSLTALLQKKHDQPDSSDLKALADEVEFIEDARYGHGITMTIWLE
jgi:serine/threonine-protein kinase RsbT